MPEQPPTTPTVPPDPHQDHAGAVAAAPSRSGRLLGLVRKLIDYGFELANTLRRRAAANDVGAMVRPFGTTDLAMIMARITRGLRLAGALEERLMRHPVPEEKKPASTSAPSQRQPRAARPPAARRSLDPDPRLTRCPPRSKSPPISAAARSAPSSSISAATSASCPGTSCGGIVAGDHRHPRQPHRADQGHIQTVTHAQTRRARSSWTPHGRNRARNSHRPVAPARPEQGAGWTIGATTGPEHGWPRRRDWRCTNRQNV